MKYVLSKNKKADVQGCSTHLSIQSTLSLQTAEHPLHLSVSPTLPELERGASDVIDAVDWELFAGP